MWPDTPIPDSVKKGTVDIKTKDYQQSEGMIMQLNPKRSIQ